MADHSEGYGMTQPNHAKNPLALCSCGHLFQVHKGGTGRCTAFIGMRADMGTCSCSKYKSD